MNSKQHLLVVILWLACMPISLAQSIVKEGFADRLVLQNLSQPTSFVMLDDGRMFIAQKGGDVRVVENELLLEEVLLHVDVDEAGEQGLGSIILDPNFETNAFVYVYYTIALEDKNRLSRFTVSGNSTIPGSEFVLMEFDPMPGKTHQGGAMRFVDDSTIVLTTGDGNVAHYAQNMDNLLGKALRIRSNGEIPEDNPYYDQLTGNFRAIYALGLRNPFTLDYSPSQDRLFFCDVGDTKWEEVNELVEAGNYGWPIVEGPLTTQTPPENYQDPVYTYDHDAGCAVIGAAFYDPETLNFPAEYENKFFFGEGCKSMILVMEPTTGEIEDTLFTLPGMLLTNMIVGNDGILYFLDFNAGHLRSLEFVGDGVPFISQQPYTELLSAGEKLEVPIEVKGEEVLTYVWYLNDQLVSGQTTNLFVIENTTVADSGSTLFCVITNDLGSATTETIVLQVTENNRPELTITNPPVELLYNNGDTLRFSGVANDNEDGILNDSLLRWKIDFYHDEHYHPFMPWTSGIGSGEAIIPRLGEIDTNVFFRITLEAADLTGLVNSTFIDIHPELIDVEVDCNKPGFEIIQDGLTKIAPFSFRSVKGNTRTLYAPPLQVANDSLFRFTSWNHQMTQNPIYINAGEEDVVYEAHYEYVRPYVDGNGNGLRGFYYDNFYFTEPYVFERIDPIINFNWDWSSPIDMFPILDSVSIRWEGEILAPISGDYLFNITMDNDDEVQIIFENDTVLDLKHQGSFKVTLESGEFYQIVIRYKENSWRSNMKMSWSFVDNPDTYVPEKFLYHDRLVPIFEGAIKPAVYPNPGSKLIYMRHIDFINDSVDHIEAINLKGQKIDLLEFENSHDVIKVQTGTLLRGMYILRVILRNDIKEVTVIIK